jgi:hypothetical protein
VSDGDKPSWWQTLPGLLTAAAAVITALTGLIVGLYQSGLLKPSRTEIIAASPAVTAEPSGSPETKQAALQPAQPTSSPPSPSAAAPSQITQPRIDLFASGNGGHLVAASADNWKATIDGDETYRCCFSPKESAVYAFKDGRAASFDVFAAFIDATRADNVHEFELAAGNDSPLGTFNVIAKCELRNVKLFETPYQECKFPAVRAKYFKVTIVSTFGTSSGYLQEFRLLGNLN